MSEFRRLVREIHRRSLWQVLGIYLAGSWVALQVVEQLAEAANLPPWVRPLSLVLLVIGLPIVMATAVVQEGPASGADEDDDATAPGPPAAKGPVREAADPPPTRGAHGLPGRTASEAGEGGIPRHLLTWRNALLGGVLAFSLLFGFAGLFVVLRSPESPFGPETAVAGEADPAIAVLPFSVQGEGVAELREGMVELLGTNLDGAGGFRTIDSRTVMARFREHVRGGTDPDFETSRRIAVAAGARYLLTGGAVAIGSGVRISAEVHDVRSGESLGSARVEGSPDDVFGLVDRLSIETLGLILGEGATDLPRVDLARATTTSLPALRAYLEGSAHFRASEFDEAARAYERAVEADSTFALAHYRLSEAVGWAESILSETGRGAIDRAARHAARLPDREARLVRATRHLQHGDAAGIPEMEAFVRRYPDDVEGWYLLGDLYFHLGGPALVEPERAEEAFRRSIELDPDFSPAHIHYVDFVFFLDPDSAAVASRLAAYGRRAEGSESFRQLRLAADLAFGEPRTREVAVAALDTTSVSLGPMMAADLSHPRLLDAQTEAAAALERRGTPFAEVWRVVNRLMRGRPAEAVSGPGRSSGPPWIRTEAAYGAHLLDELVPAEAVPPASLDASLALDAIDTTSALQLYYAGAYAADRGRTREAEAAIDRLRSREEELLQAGDTTAATFAGGAVAGVEGHLAASRGDVEAALARFEAARTAMVGNYPYNAANDLLRWRTGRLLVASGRTGEAVRYLESAYYQTAARLELGRVYEELGDAGKARRAYEDFVAAWHDAEEPFQPLVEEAKQALLRLTGEFGEGEAAERPAGVSGG